jgi:hypothetical protein
MMNRCWILLAIACRCWGDGVAEPSTFRAECARLSAAAAGSFVSGKEGWLFFVPELRHLAAGKFWGESASAVGQTQPGAPADPLPAIVDFHEQLQSMGVELILLPVPAKATIYPDRLLDAFPATGPRLDAYHEEFYGLLRAAGITVIDLTPDFLNEGEPPLYCLRDTHWSGRGCVVAAERIAAALASRPWLTAIPRRKFVSEERLTEITGDLARLANPAAPVKETLALRFVGTSSLDQPVLTDSQSPLLLLGDSHCLVFHDGGDMHARGAGLPDQLAAELGFAVDLIAVRGSGATPARVNLLRKVRTESGYLARKKAVLWCFSVREFTESSGWQKVPVVKR